ncbi:PREDICTED: uncharacterized protein LOC107328478 [Acropora digitifera]|uniref:uncharacterized protein LOC107328478 n=1 Tax=Acropora digitifera TaxID=70779 RepID=UPI00077AFE68|nr:PREDICTED: uncharacterized protein LOC107328478 [Acropora digitifera]
MHPRYQFDVPGPIALWDIDGLHKLIRWEFVVHGGIDVLSRLVVYLKCATNNRTATVMASFFEGTRKYGIPSRVRSDYGGENIEVGRFMESMRGTNRGLHIQGSSVHNQRIERLHRGTLRCCLSSFYSAFTYMESEGILNVSNDTDVFCLHYIYLSRINRALEEFRLGWNHHSVSTEGNQTPYQLWIAGVMGDNYQGYTAVQDIRNPDLNVYGIDNNSVDLYIDSVSETVTVLKPTCPLTEDQMSMLSAEIDSLANSRNFGVDIFLRTVDSVAHMPGSPTHCNS